MGTDTQGESHVTTGAETRAVGPRWDPKNHNQKLGRDRKILHEDHKGEHPLLTLRFQSFSLGAMKEYNSVYSGFKYNSKFLF